MQLPAQLHKRNPDTHKGHYGHVFVLGGSRGLTGAVCLCAQAALRAGCGLVTVGIPNSLNTIFEIKLTEIMSLPLPDTKKGSLSLAAYGKVCDFSRNIDVIAAGCGASRSLAAMALLRRVIGGVDKPQVIDADGINALAGRITTLTKRRSQSFILTPHEREFSRLIGKSSNFVAQNRKNLAKEFALRYNLILVLKGHRTIVTDGKSIFENTTGNAGMATAGSGDVLTGIISSLLAQGLKVFDAARLGVYLHGLAGDYAARQKTLPGLIASDIIYFLPQAFRRAQRDLAYRG